MRLMTGKLQERIPGLYCTECEDDPVVYAKFFTPDASWTWYVLEFDGEDLCFGYVIGHYPELGYFSLEEIESVRGPLGLSVERDRNFAPTRLSGVMKRERNRRQHR